VLPLVPVADGTPASAGWTQPVTVIFPAGSVLSVLAFAGSPVVVCCAPSATAETHAIAIAAHTRFIGPSVNKFRAADCNQFATSLDTAGTPWSVRLPFRQGFGGQVSWSV